MLKRLSAHVGVRCPKVECTEQVRSLAGELPGRPLHLVESALGLELAYSLATAAPQVASLGLGEADLRSDLGVSDDEGLTWARRVIEQLRHGGDDGVGVGVLEDGSFVDRAMVQQAETILQIAGTGVGPDPAGGEQEAGR